MKRNLIFLILLTTAVSVWAVGSKETPQRVFLDVVEAVRSGDNERLNFYFNGNPKKDLFTAPGIDWAQYTAFLHVKPTGNTMTQSEDGRPLFIVRADVANRSWVFRTMGYGTDNWKQILSALKVIGYDDSISIEHEDGLMSAMEGLDKAIEYLQGIIIKGDKAEMWWA